MTVALANLTNGRPWTAAEDATLRQHYVKRGGGLKAARELGRSFVSVTHRARRLGLTTHRRCECPLWEGKFYIVRNSFIKEKTTLVGGL